MIRASRDGILRETADLIEWGAGLLVASASVSAVVVVAARRWGSLRDRHGQAQWAFHNGGKDDERGGHKLRVKRRERTSKYAEAA